MGRTSILAVLLMAVAAFTLAAVPPNQVRDTPAAEAELAPPDVNDYPTPEAFQKALLEWNVQLREAARAAEPPPPPPDPFAHVWGCIAKTDEACAGIAPKPKEPDRRAEVTKFEIGKLCRYTCADGNETTLTP